MYPHQIDLQSSKIFTAIIIILQISALICIYLSSLPIVIKLILYAFVMVVGYVNFYKFILLHNPKSIISINTQKKNQWYLINRAGELLSAQLYGDSICTRWLVILNFRVQHSQRNLSLLIFSDSIEAEDFRRLRAYLTVLGRSMD